MTAPADIPLDKVMDLLLDAVCIVDATGHYLYVNAAFERIFGYAPDEVVGRQMLHLVHPDDRAQTIRAVAEIMSGQEKTRLENRYIRKDGEIVHIMWSARWSQEHQARIAVARDISAQRRAEATQAAVYEISEVAQAADNLGAVYRTIHKVLGGLLPARNCAIALYDETGGTLTFPYFVDERGPPPAARRLDDSALAGEVVRSGRSLLLGPARLQGTVADDEEVRGARYWLGVPLKGQAGSIGALAVKSYAEETRYNARDVLLLHYVATQVSNAIERRHAR